MRDLWQLSVQAFNKESCEHMIEEFKKLPEMDGQTEGGSKDHRKSKVRWIHHQDKLVDQLLRYVNEANAISFNVDIQQEMGEMQFGEYDASYGGKFDWHHDVLWHNPRNYDRKLSLVLQLSDPATYEGGEFEFQEADSPPIDMFSKQGSLLIFPSYLRHRVKEVTSGVRYSLVSWVRGPRWR